MTSVNHLFDFIKEITPLEDTAVLWIIAVSIPALIVFLITAVNALIAVYFSMHCIFII